jgi:predicted nucleic acid-binding protein
MVAPPQPEPPRLFFDASVIVAGAASVHGASRAMLILAEVSLIRAVVSPFVLEEVERNLRWKLPVAVPYFQRIREAIAWEIVPDPSQKEGETWATIVPLKDAPIIAAAVNAKPHRLITLDAKHLIDPPQVAAQSGLVIRTPGQVMQEIRQYLAEGFGQAQP